MTFGTGVKQSAFSISLFRKIPEIFEKMNHATLAQRFIAEIWNDGLFEKLPRFLHPDFADHSLPPALSPDAAGLRKWIENTSASFVHQTFIEAQVTEGAHSMLQIRMELEHTGPWRDIGPTGIQVMTRGFRHFTFKDGKIIAHQAVIDGQTIENALRQATHGCSVQK